MDNGASGQESKRLDIRKYPNRRYYDATRSQHVRLEEIHELIREGYEIQVTDSKTGHDITGKVLAQIILELDPPKLDVFPAPLLHRVIRANEQLVREFTDKYFNQALSCFLESQKHFESYLRQAVGLQPAVPEWARMFNPFLMNPLLGPFMSRPDGRAPGQESGEAAELRRQIAELESRLVSLQSATGGKAENGGGAA